MKFSPGDTVPASGVYRVEHASHRLMHEVTLLVDTFFPRCKQCKDAVRFHRMRTVPDSQVLPFRENTLLEEYPKPEPPLAAAM